MGQPAFKPLKYQVINPKLGRVVFRGLSYARAVEIVREFRHLSFKAE